MSAPGVAVAPRKAAPEVSARPEVEYVALRELKPAKRNPKGHDIPGIASSISQFGFAEVLIENAKTGRLVAGHGRLEALQLLEKTDPKKVPRYIRVDPAGRWLAPVLRGVEFKSEQEAEGYLLADNRFVELGGWNQAALAEVLSDLVKAGGVESLVPTGWSIPDYERLLVQPGAPPPAIADGATGEGVIKQIVFPFRDADMPLVLARLARVMNLTDTTDHTAAILALLDVYEKAGR